VTKILSGDSHSRFSQIKDKNSLSSHISYFPDTLHESWNIRQRRRTRATTLMGRDVFHGFEVTKLSFFTLINSSQ